MKRKLFKLSLTICIIICIFAIPQIVSAATEGNYTYYVSNGEAKISAFDTSVSGEITIPATLGGYPVTSISYSAFYYCRYLTSITIPDSVTSIGDSAFNGCSKLTSITIPDGVTSIGNYAFKDCSKLTSITIPDSVTSIGDYTFYGCSSLTSINIPDSVTSIGYYAFRDCSKLTSITIPDSVTSIDDCAFSGCSSLTSINIPDSVTSIGSNAFSGCSSLTSINIPDSVTSIDDCAFSSCSSLTSINIPDSVTSIGNWAFNDCSKLTSINIPDSVTSIGNWAFNDCSKLTSITIPDGVTSIGEGAFYDCSSLTSINIPNSVTSINNGTFYNCSSLTSITIPNSVTSINVNAFYNCSSLTSLIIPNSVTYIGNSAFYKCSSLTSLIIPNSVTSIGNSAFYKCSSLTSLIIPNSVTSIGNSAFDDCSSLTSITIPDSVTSIGNWAFRYCSKLTSITIPDSVTSISDCAFQYCSKLTSINIPDSVTSIGGWAFSNCSSLKSIIIPDGVTSIGEGAFKNCSYLKSIIIPDNITYIPEELFYRCYSLESIAIPVSVTKIDYDAFYSCDSLKTVYYRGNSTQWNGIYNYEKEEFTDATMINNCIYLHILGEGHNKFMTHIIPSGNKFDFSLVEKEGYTFKLYSDEQMNWEIYDDTIFIEDTTAYSKYIINKYTYKFVDDKGNVIKSITADYGSIIELPENAPVKENTAQYTYEFIDWNGYSEGMTLLEDTTFTPNFKSTINKYTYTFLDNDGNTIHQRVVNYGSTITKPNTTPIKPSTAQYDYTFSHWNGYTDGMTVTGDITFKPVFTSAVRKYTYTFFNHDGSIISTKTVNYGTKIIVPTSIPTKPKTAQYTYEFSYWENYTDNMVVTGTHTFNPIFISTVNQYTYKFVDDNGMEMKSVTADYGTVITAPDTEPTKEDTKQYTYLFSGWNGYTSNMKLTSDITFTPNFSSTVNQYTYTFVDDNGYEVLSKTVDYGTIIEIPDNSPVKQSTAKYSYIFTNWDNYTLGMAITENITFKPVYTETINKYTYTFLNGDGSVLKEKKVEYGTVIVLPEELPAKNKTAEFTYTFDKWISYNEGMILEADITFTPSFTKTLNQYTYKFIDENGTVYKQSTLDYGSIIIKPEQIPEKESDMQYTYVFDYWYGYSDSMLLTKDVIFTPKFTEITNKYTYKFLNEDGSIYEEKTVDYGTLIVLPSTTPYKDAPYTFDCWEGYTEGMIITNNVTFSAKFKYMTYEIIVNGYENNNTTVTYGNNYTIETIKKTGYKFEGYYTEENGNGIKLTDESGKSLSKYNYTDNIIVYPYFSDILLNKLTISGTKSASVGDKGINYSVQFGTDKNAQYATIFVKYPNELILDKAETVDFAEISLESSKSDGECTIAEYLCIYSYDGTNIPKETKIEAFKLIFNVSEKACPKNITVELTPDSALLGNVDYFFESFVAAETIIKPKLAESIIIVGDDSISGTSKYIATVLPEYTTNKEVEWSVSDENIAQISDDGILTPLKKGSVTINATSVDNTTIIGTKTVIITNAWAMISSLNTNGYMLKEFEPTTHEYIVYVDKEAETITISPTYINGTLKANGSTILSGRSREISLTGDETVITLSRTNVPDCDDSTYTLTVIKDSSALITTAEKSTTGYDFKITLNKNRIEDFETANVLIALYDENGKMIKSEIVKVSNEQSDISKTVVANKAATSYKIMLLDGIGNLKPLCIDTEKSMD